MTYRGRRGFLLPEDHEPLDQVRQILSQEQSYADPNEPAQLLGHVFIGNQHNAESLRLLRKLGVTHVLNCAGYKGRKPKPPGSPYEGLGIDYLEFLAEDNDLYDITQHFREAFRYLDNVRRQGGIALVHCALGINRSGAVCIAYLMVHCKQPLLRTIRKIKSKRRVLLSNMGFQIQLVKFARDHSLLDSMPSTRVTMSSTREKIHQPLASIPFSSVRPSASPLDTFACNFLERSKELRSSLDKELSTPHYKPVYNQWDNDMETGYKPRYKPVFDEWDDETETGYKPRYQPVINAWNEEANAGYNSRSMQKRYRKRDGN